jgi:hypothetical protein
MSELEGPNLPPSPCTNCGKLVDSATALDGDHVPKPGDVTICLDCRHLMVFADDMTVRNPTDDEVREMAGDPDILMHMNALAKFDEWRKRQ